MKSISELSALIARGDNYNLHSHTQFCDGHADVDTMASAAADMGFHLWGITPHSPVPLESGANMSFTDVNPYLETAHNAKEHFAGKMDVLVGMEVDYLDSSFGPHADLFQKMPLDLIIGSVHFVPNQQGIPFDCDGSEERFAHYLVDSFNKDLRYVVEKYFEQVLRMIEHGGFQILGHFDKIAGNAWALDPEIENERWYQALVEDVISHAASAGIMMEINTKALDSRRRFYPASRWWPRIIEAGIPLCVNSDAHWPDRINAGRPEALKLLATI